MPKIINVDFKEKKLINIEEIEAQEKSRKLDPVLERIKTKLDEKSFEIFKKTVDVWMEENFLYEMEERNNND